MEFAPLLQQRRETERVGTSSGAPRHLPHRGRLWEALRPVSVKAAFKVDGVTHRGKALESRFPHQISIRIRLNHNDFY